VVLEALGLLLIGFGLLAGLALLTHDAGDPSFRMGPVHNAAGPVGASLSALLLGGFGPGAVVLVAGVLVVGGRLLLGRGLPAVTSRFWVGGGAVLLALASLPPLLSALAPGLAARPAGLLGARLAAAESALLSAPGAFLMNVLVLVLGVLGLVGVAPGTALRAALRVAVWVGALLAEGLDTLVRAARRASADGLRAARSLARSAAVWREQRARRARLAAFREPEAVEAPAPPAPLAGGVVTAPPRRRAEAPDIVDHRRSRRDPEQEEFTFAEAAPTGPYRLPDLDLFQRPPETGRTLDRESLITNSRILEKKLLDFGVQGRVVTVHPGPVITMYEFEPASGVKVNRIVNLSDDLALALRALSVRIIAPIPGKSVVGIEIPNPEREVVYIRDLLEARSFRSSASKLTLALGKDIFGTPVSADLTQMPHLLVAGATGTGKSVFLNSLLCSILFRATPDEVKLLLIDPKLLELSVYEGVPHLIADVVTNPKRAAAALLGIVRKMEERYQRMAALGVRNIAQYNAKVDEEIGAGKKTFRLRPKAGETEGEQVPFQRLPYIVVVIDELADLMVVCARDVEESLQRLAQMARAAGIHLVLATQRPSVDVLTGVIKANFPARLSFQVSSRTDSRTILDQNGAETLLGQGDMLFLPPGTSKLQRMHGPYVSEREVTQLVGFLRGQGRPEFDDTLMKVEKESEAREEGEDDVDELYDRAVAIVAETRNASISYVQRRLKVGYNRAARMVERMEAEGVVGPQDGTKGREVYVQPIGADLVE
jgi:S-DNA-T family DNA segregation ATPase FtsK/SpoIIIE